MNSNAKLYLLSAVSFDVGSICAFITHFTGNVTGNLWLILGVAFGVISMPMYLLFIKEWQAGKK